MSAITVTDLKRIMRQCIGDDDTVSLEGDILQQSFTSLGYDSLALLETAAIVKREFGVEIDDSELHSIDTPQALLDKVNGTLTAA